jgi:membrane-bound serine protease (ClpP class)
VRKLIAFFLLLAAVCQAAEPKISDGAVVVVPVKGEISETQYYFLRRILKDAEAANASAFILDMDTRGGALDSTQRIVQTLLKTKIPTYTYVNTAAGSAGALIALSTKNVYMAPVSAIGAAAPVVGGGQEIPETMKAKTVSFYSGYFRSVAEQNGYNPNLVDAFMNLDKEVKIGDRVLNPEGAVLTLSPKEAMEKFDGKPLLAKGVATDVAALVKEAGLNEGAIVKVTPSGFEQMAFWITALAPLLLMAGMLGAWLEFKTPGFGIAGVLALICFALFFAGHYIAGLTGFEVVAVFALGVILILLELFVFPGVMVLATAGIALMLGSLLFAMVDFYPSQPLAFSFDMLVMPLVNLGIAVLLFMILASVLARFLPELPFFRRLVLAQAAPEGPSLKSTPAELFPVRVQVGDVGVARTTLRPAGKADFGELAVDVVSDGEFVEPGTRLVVLSVRGKQVMVGVKS